MKKLLLLIILCAWPLVAIAQMHEMSYQLNDSIVLFSSWQNVVFQPLRNKELLPTKALSVWKELLSKPTNKAKMTYSRVMIIRPPRIIVHQQCVMYGSQIIFLQKPRVYIEPAKIIYDPPAQ